MEKRIGVSAGILAVVPAVALAIFEVMEWKMPTQLAIALLAVTGITGLLALGVLGHSVWMGSKPIRGRYHWQLPLYRVKPNPYQGLIDIAKQQQENPTTHLVMTDRIIMSFTREAKRPYIRLRICFANLGLNQVLVGNPEGYPYFNNEKFPDCIKNVGNSLHCPAGHGGGSFDIDVYVPPEFLKNVCDEVDSASGEVRSIRFGQVSAKVQAEIEGAPMIQWSLGATREIFRPNR